MTKEQWHAQVQWLYEKANPALRLWAAQRLGLPKAAQQACRADLLAHSAAQYWLAKLLDMPNLPRRQGTLHGSFDYCLENCSAMASQLGLREGDDPALRAVDDGLLGILADNQAQPGLLNPVEAGILAGHLLAMGHQEEPILHIALQRLQDGASLARRGNFDIHVDPAGYPTISASRRGHPLVDPALTDGNRYRLPLVQDLCIFSRLPQAILNRPDVQGLLDEYIGGVLTEGYQRLPQGYGLMLLPPRTYYGIGWSLHVPGFLDGNFTASTLWWAVVLSPFAAARRSPWFARAIAHLESFGKDGVYRFPAAYVAEQPDKYAVGGGHMGLGEDRRGREAQAITSTAWMLRLYENAPEFLSLF